MGVRLNGAPSRRLIALLGAITIVPLVSLLWLGRYLLEEDRAAAADEARTRLGRSADQVGAAIERAIAEDDQRLAAGARDWPEGVALVTFGEPIGVMPAGRVAYLPVAPALPEADSRLFDPVDRAEFRDGDQAGAATLLEDLATSSNAAVSQTARLRLARTLEASGAADRALAIYEPLTLVDSTALAGTPVSLVARYRRCQVLANQGRLNALRTEAAALHRDLVAGRWRLTPAMYALYITDADAWIGQPDEHPTASERLAAVVVALWNRRETKTEPAGDRHLSIEVDGVTFAVLWQARPDGGRALIASPEYVRTRWLAGAADVARQRDVTIQVPAMGDPDNASTAVGVDASPTGLPWPFRVVPAADAVPPRATSRRPLLLTALAVLIAMALTSSYFIARAVQREIAVARLKSDFVAAVSHEFRTPLTTLRQFTDMLREGSVAGDDQLRVCYDAQARATDRLTRLVESVLDFGSIEAGQRRYQFEPVRCGALVRQVAGDVQRDVQAAGYRIDCEADDTVEVDADSEALGRAVRNLLENAVKYSPDVRVVNVTVAQRDDGVAIAVRDRGIGIPPAERRSIFEQFQRGSEARARGIAGTGVGLAMVDHIVRAHRGRVEVDSEPGKGSTFTILLPAAAGLTQRASDFELGTSSS